MYSSDSTAFYGFFYSILFIIAFFLYRWLTSRKNERKNFFMQIPTGFAFSQYHNRSGYAINPTDRKLYVYNHGKSKTYSIGEVRSCSFKQFETHHYHNEPMPFDLSEINTPALRFTVTCIYTDGVKEVLRWRALWGNDKTPHFPNTFSALTVFKEKVAVEE